MNQHKNIVRNLSVLFVLQVICISLFAYGLFFFHLQIKLESKIINPIIEFEKNGTDITQNDRWFKPQYNRIAFFVIKNNNKKFQSEFKDLDIKCKTENCKIQIEIQTEPSCFEEQEIIPLMTGNYPTILDHIYSHQRIIQDSLIHQLYHHQKKFAIYGKTQKWQEIFPEILSNYSALNDSKKLENSLYFMEYDFMIGEYKNSTELSLSLNNIFQNKSGHDDYLDNLTLILIYEKYDCSKFGSRKNRLTGYTMDGFQTLVKKENLGIAIKDIDIAPTLCALFGISIPFENFGKLIFNLYSSQMPQLQNLNNRDAEMMFTMLIQAITNLKQVHLYLHNFNNQKYRHYFSQQSVQDQIEKCKILYQQFTEIQEMINNQDSNSQSLKNSILKMIKDVEIEIENIQLLIAKVSFFGAGPILITAMILLLISFVLYLSFLLTFKDVMGFIRNNFSFFFTYRNFYSIDFFNLLIVMIEIYVFLFGSMLSRLDYKRENKIILLCCFSVSLLQCLLSCIFSNFTNQINHYLLANIFYCFLLIMLDGEDMWPNHIYELLVGVGLILMLAIFISFKVGINQYQQNNDYSFMIYRVLNIGNIVFSAIYFIISDHYLIQLAILGFFFVQCGSYILLLRKDLIAKLTNVSNILLIFLNVMPIIFVISAKHSIFIKLSLFIIMLIFYLYKQQLHLQDQHYQGIIQMLLFLIMFGENMIGTKELKNLNYFQKENMYLNIFLNIVQMSIPSLVISFLLPVWVKFINQKNLDFDELFQNNDENQNMQNISRFAAVFTMIGFYLLRICLYNFSMVFRFLREVPDIGRFRILMEGFIFESVTYLSLFSSLILICYVIEYVQLHFSAKKQFTKIKKRVDDEIQNL